MKKVLSACLAAATLAFVGPMPAAHADTPSCVTRAEYRAVHKGMSLKKVAHIFDVGGHRMSIATSGGYASQVRSYHTCSPYSSVAISYSKVPGGIFKLAAKSAVWVS